MLGDASVSKIEAIGLVQGGLAEAAKGMSARNASVVHTQTTFYVDPRTNQRVAVVDGAQIRYDNDTNDAIVTSGRLHVDDRGRPSLKARPDTNTSSQPQLIEDKILEELQYIKGRINTSSQILTDKQRTAFFFVLVPEEMIILDTRKAAELFARFDVPIAGYVVNRVLPEELRRGNIPTYLKNRIQLQEKYLSDIQNSLGSEIMAYVPEMERDVTGLPMIERLARQLFEDSK